MLPAKTEMAARPTLLGLCARAVPPRDEVLEDDKLGLGNNIGERAIKPFVIGNQRRAMFDAHDGSGDIRPSL